MLTRERGRAVSERGDGLSIVTVMCQDEAVALEQWSTEDAVDEIVVVEFGVPSPVARRALDTSKAVVVRTAAKEPWAKGLALNLGIAGSSRGTILVLDRGCALRDIGLYRETIARRGGYLTGYGTDKSVSSEIAMFRHADWEAAGGYHEYLLGWGFEDEDLFNRLENSGLAHRFFERGDFSGAAEAIAAAPLTSTRSDPGLELPERLERHRGFQNNRNRILAGLAPWRAAMPPLRPRRFGRPRAGVMTCELAPRTALERRLQDCASYLAARFLHNVPESVAYPMLARMIDERSGDYAVRAARQHQIDSAVAARRRLVMPNG